MALAADYSSSSSSSSSIGDQPKQPSSFKISAFLVQEVSVATYDQVNDKAFCFTCLEALGNLKICAIKGDEVFLSRGYTGNWKDASGDKRVGFSAHKRFQVHKYCFEVLTKAQKSVTELLSSEHEKQKVINRTYLRKVVERYDLWATKRGEIT